jgi:hypothetical protein
MQQAEQLTDGHGVQQHSANTGRTERFVLLQLWLMPDQCLPISWGSLEMTHVITRHCQLPRCRLAGTLSQKSSFI